MRRTRALVTLLPVATLLVLGAPASAAVHGAARAHSWRAPAAAGHAVDTFTGGWQATFDANGDLTGNLTFNSASYVSAYHGTSVSLVAGGPGLALTFSPGTQIQAGQSYSQASIDIGGASCPGALQFDQFVAATSVTTIGVEYDGQCQDGSEIFGEIAVNLQNDSVGQGYYLYDQYGDLSGFGNDNYLTYLGNLGLANLNAPVVGMAVTPDGGGYWMLGGDGGVFTYGDAGFFGSTGALHLNRPVVGMAPTPDGQGYWFVASDGGIFAFGDATFYGSTGNIHLNQPIVGMAATPDGKGYWLVAADGGIFAFGDAPFYGSTGNLHLNKPIVGMSATPDGRGYWFVASDGGIFAYGDAAFYGSTGSLTLQSPIVGMAATPDGHGYYLVADDGGIFNYGDAVFAGSLGGEGVSGVAGVAIT